MIYLFALLIGVVAGLRAMTAPAAVSWATYLGWIAILELINDQRPTPPSRKAPSMVR